jgi:hypothetical protein
MVLLMMPGLQRDSHTDLLDGVDPDDESYYVYSNTNRAITQADADTTVRAAGVAYLGWVMTP